MSSEKPTNEPRPRVLIIGGGFAGIECASRLETASVDITLADLATSGLMAW